MPTNNRSGRTYILLATLLSIVTIAHPLRAQAAADRDSAAAQAQGPVAIRIFAEASAREVTFAKQPSVHVRLNGALDSIRVLERRNLPSPVVVGTTYRDVYVAVEIFGRLTAECLAAQASGNAPRMDCASLDLRGIAPPTRR